MPRVPVVAIALWASATALATAGAWAGVAAVTAEVTGEHPVALPPAEVASMELPATSTTTTSTTVAPTTTTTSPPAATTTTTVPVVAAEVTTTTTVPSQTATFASEGGVIVVACRDLDIELTSARPNDGYAMEVKDPGPVEVRVAFQGDVDRSVIGARCEGGAPVRMERPAHRPRRGSFSGGATSPAPAWPGPGPGS